MQQTTTYKLNKPESTDTFSVSPLNENADKLEAQLARLDGADAAETAARQALDQRVTALEVQKMYFGTYVGTGENQFLDLGFTPKAFLSCDHNLGGAVAFVTRGNPMYFVNHNSYVCEIVTNGVQFRYMGTAPIYNLKNNTYSYIALV